MKRRLLSHSQIILVSNDSITADTQEKTDKLMQNLVDEQLLFMNLKANNMVSSDDLRMSLMVARQECLVLQVLFFLHLTSVRSATTLLHSGPWKKPATDIDPTTGVPCSQNGSNSNLINLSQEKTGALIFRTLAVRVSRYGAHASLDRVAVDEVAALTKNKSTSAILKNIQRVFDDKEEINIIGNSAFNSQLTDLANTINKRKDDEKKVQSIIDELYD